MLDALLNMTKIESGNVAPKIEVAPLSDLLRPVQVRCRCSPRSAGSR